MQRTWQPPIAVEDATNDLRSSASLAYTFDTLVRVAAVKAETWEALALKVVLRQLALAPALKRIVMAIPNPFRELGQAVGQ